jgi:hypothetical protein
MNGTERKKFGSALLPYPDYSHVLLLHHKDLVRDCFFYFQIFSLQQRPSYARSNFSAQTDRRDVRDPQCPSVTAAAATSVTAENRRHRALSARTTMLVFLSTGESVF